MRGLLIGLAVGAGMSGAAAQVLNVRPGGWEITMNISDKSKAMPSGYKTCVTKEDLESGLRAFQEPSDDCSYKFSVRSPTRWAGTITCTGDEPHKSEFEMTAPNPETIRMKSTTAGDKGPIVIEMNGRFASASCKGYGD